MNSHSEHTSTNYPQLAIYRIALLLLSLYSASIIVWLLALPRDPSVYPLFGIPARRILMLGMSLVLAGLWSIPLALSYRKPAVFSRHTGSFQAWLAKKNHWRLVFLAALLAFVLSGLWLLLLAQNSYFVLAPPPKPDFNPHIRMVNQAWLQTKPALALYQPLILHVIGTSAVALVFVLLIHFTPAYLHQQFQKQKIYWIAGIFLLIVFVWRILGWTSIRLEQDFSTFGWYTLGAPILETQAFWVFLLGLGVLAAGYYLPVWAPRMLEKAAVVFARKNRADLLLCLIIWMAAAYYWNLLPTLPNWFVSEPTYPNYSIYPNSDAIVYDTTAQSLLVGAGYQSGTLPFARRPIYALFLAGLYQVAGPDFELLTHLQAAIFGVFPALIYLATSRLHSRLAGLLVALLIVLRETNAIALVNRITISTSRMMMSEMPAAVLMALALYLSVNWFQQARSKPVTALWIGGVVAASMLVRIEAAIFLFVFFAAALIIHYRKPRSWFVTLGLATLGAVLFLSPWLWRNWQKTGYAFIEQPGERLQYITVRTGLADAIPEPNPDLMPAEEIPGAPPIEPAPLESAESSRQGFGKFFERFGYNYINNYLQAMLIFPDAFRLLDSLVAFGVRGDFEAFKDTCCDRINYYNRLPFWGWGVWKGEIPSQSIIPIVFTLLLLAVGFVKLSEMSGLAGLFPLALVAAQYLMVSMLNISGGRFVQMLDWVWLIYYGVGLATIAQFVFGFFGLQPCRFFIQPVNAGGGKQPAPNPTSMARPIIGALTAIFLLGAAIPLAERLIPPRYTPETFQAGIEELLASPEIATKYPELTAMLQEQAARGILVFQGRALYPRFHLEFKGEPGTNPTPFTVKDFARFSFFVAGPRNTGVLLPIHYAPLTDFPNASDVLVVGCQDDIFVRASVVYNRSTGSILLSSERDQLASCPPLP